MQIDLPDADGRRKLFELYGAGLDLRLDDLEPVIARTEGVSPAFIKELLRKAAMVAATSRHRQRQLVVTDDHVNAALDELLAETGSLTRLLLGGATDRPPPTTMASMAWLPGAAPGGSRPELGGDRRPRPPS